MSAFASFNPDKFVTTAVPAAAEPHSIYPPAWRHGLIVLGEQNPPRGATPARWDQIVRDSLSFAQRWGHEAFAFGWSIGNVFGFDVDQADGLTGLVFDIRGGSVVNVDERRVAIRHPGSIHYHHRAMPDDAPPIWSFRGRI